MAEQEANRAKLVPEQGRLQGGDARAVVCVCVGAAGEQKLCDRHVPASAGLHKRESSFGRRLRGRPTSSESVHIPLVARPTRRHGRELARLRLHSTRARVQEQTDEDGIAAKHRVEQRGVPTPPNSIHAHTRADQRAADPTAHAGSDATLVGNGTDVREKRKIARPADRGLTVVTLAQEPLDAVHVPPPNSHEQSIPPVEPFHSDRLLSSSGAARSAAAEA
jgi:hypothetical protein